MLRFDQILTGHYWPFYIVYRHLYLMQQRSVKVRMNLRSIHFQNSNENIVRISALKIFTDHILMFAIAYIYQEGATEKKCASKY